MPVEKRRSRADPLLSFEERKGNHKYLRDRFPYLAMPGFLDFQVRLQEACPEPVLRILRLSVGDEGR